MAEKRKKSGSILLRFRGKTRNFDVFPAEQWPDQHEADLGLYRLCEYAWEGGKRREKWLCDTSGETEADAKAADEAALIMAQLCAMTLNKTDAAKRQRENRP